uniref:Uncharacterized protein n=1 Tax=Timspurckia oligopyrenoides TaxID=708627 RepID=A0A7S0ZEU7_9RHOD
MKMHRSAGDQNRLNSEASSLDRPRQHRVPSDTSTRIPPHEYFQNQTAGIESFQALRNQIASRRSDKLNAFRGNECHSLFVRILHRSTCSRSIQYTRRFQHLTYDSIFPSATAAQVENAPDVIFRKFSSDGQYLLAFSRCHRDLLIYRLESGALHRSGFESDYSVYSQEEAIERSEVHSHSQPVQGRTQQNPNEHTDWNGLNPSTLEAAFPQYYAIPPNSNALRGQQDSTWRQTQAYYPAGMPFSMFFTQTSRTTIGTGNEILCRDFCLLNKTGEYVILGSWAAPEIRIPTNDDDSESADLNQAAVETVAKLESITLHCVHVQSGRVTDRFSLTEDFVFLDSHQGVDLNDDMLIVLSIRHQIIRFLEIRADGKFREVHELGSFCFDDDRLLLLQQEERERRCPEPPRVRPTSSSAVQSTNMLPNGASTSPQERDGDDVDGSDYFLVAATPQLRDPIRPALPTIPVRVGSGLGRGLCSRGFFTGLMHKILAYQYRKHVSESTESRFFRTLHQYTSLIMLKVQFLDSKHLLIRLGYIDSITRSGDTVSSVLFLVVFSLEDAAIVNMYENRSEELLKLYHEYLEYFWRSWDYHPSRKDLDSLLSALSSGPEVRRTIGSRMRSALSLLPISPQIICPSPYLNPDLYSFDERRSASLNGNRPLPVQEYPSIKFISRKSRALKFKLRPGPRSLPLSATRIRRTAVFLFNPVYPFVISIQYEASQPSCINFHLKNLR